MKKRTLLAVEKNVKQAVVSGGSFDQDQLLNDGPWKGYTIDSGRIILLSDKSQSSLAEGASFASCNADMLRDLLVGMIQRQWTGMVQIDTGFGLKKLYFKNGSLTFAASNLIDDRLGEVIYREGFITLDQMTNSAVQVDRNTRFGQVLLRDKIFSNLKLWEALKTQVKEIFRSVFLSRDIFIEFSLAMPPTEVAFDESSAELIDSAYYSGRQFLSFQDRVGSDSKATPVEGPRLNLLSEGTFKSDMIQLVRQKPLVVDLLDFSKLTQLNTLWFLHRMSCLGYITFTGLSDPVPSGSPSDSNSIRHKLDALTMLQTMAFKSFVQAKVPFPISEIQAFTWSLNSDELAVLYLDDTGVLHPECVNNVISQSNQNHGRHLFFERKIDAIIRFTLQISGDLLPFERSKAIKREFNEIVS
jgi:hypothetical protein